MKLRAIFKLKNNVLMNIICSSMQILFDRSRCELLNGAKKSKNYFIDALFFSLKIARSFVLD